MPIEMTSGKRLHSWRRLSLLMLLAMMLLQPVCSSGAGECTLPPDLRIDRRPDAEGPPTRVRVGILVADINGIDDVNQSLTGDFISIVEWTDPRLADLAGCRFPIAAVWSPHLEILNSSQMTIGRAFQLNQVEVEAGGRVRYFQRRFGSVSTYHELSRFPFDPQVFRLRTTSMDYDAREIALDINQEFTRAADLLNIPDWTIGTVSAHIERKAMAELGSEREILVLEIPAKRNTNFYIWKVLVPLALIVMMSWSVFWINPAQFGPQIGLSATSMLTLIAFQFALTGVLPKLSYFTVMDTLILGSTVLTFLSLVEAVLTTNLVVQEKQDLANRIDHWCRWLFPLAFVVFWGMVLMR